MSGSGDTFKRVKHDSCLHGGQNLIKGPSVITIGVIKEKKGGSEILKGIPA